jgi:hypothetical protein
MMTRGRIYGTMCVFCRYAAIPKTMTNGYMKIL